MKISRLVLAIFGCLFLALHSHAANNTFNVALSTPRLQTLQTSIPVEAETAEVALTFLYNTKGQILCTSDSTVDGAPATCVGTMVRRTTGFTYTLTIKSATTPATVIVLKGTLGGTAVATYKGPKGRARIAAQPVTITSEAPTTARIDLVSAVNPRRQITGTGTVDAYGTNGSVAGRLRGTVSDTKLSWVLTQAPRVISFKGVRSGDVYVGSLKVTVPPARETIQAFEVPASAFALSSGLAAFRGTVLAGSNSIPAAAAGVKVTVKSDINGDGRFVGNEVADANTDAQGHYQISFPVSLDRPVMLEMSKDGYAKYMTMYPNVTPGSAVQKNSTLQALTTLSVSDGTAQSDDGKIMLMGLPSNIRSVEARVFNPVTETAQFPGEFADNENNLLVSSVFSAIEARNASGDPVTDLGANTMLCMEVPKDTWSTMGDLTAGNGQIDIPLYFYDETSGQWKRNAANGWLEDSSRVKIPEAQLAAIQNGSYSGRVYGAGPITHLSYWNIDWPISSHACIQATIVSGTGQPVEGATITVKGISYTGSTAGEVTQAGGGLCADIMRSETPGEDVDRDGVTGETQQVQILVHHGTNFYSFGPFNSPSTQGSCGGGCLDVGPLSLTEANRLTATLCTINGRMVYSGTAVGGTSALNPGDPIVGATVFGFDAEASDAFNQCLLDGTCGFGTTDANGNFSFTTVVLSGLTIHGNKTEVVSQNGYDYYFGLASFTGCPAAPITLSADFSSLRFVILELLGTGIEDGVFTLINNQPFAAFTRNGTTYVATSQATAQRPTSTGTWLTLNLLNGTTGGPAGTITFTVNSLSPLSGTWTTSTAGGSGTFAEEPF